ncbi:hypothetical protein HPP92_008047 [Vanilla planifolia]|uniref:Uncharacterized protein n=1 Tax=Vanilla planifolia TaxID=51239 RepID=A0A835RNJ0_VANPL|nr:hypothetical protein HPP92_008033 [Vanilla planifolia]KAG0491184.1 hypothetical protein HPP92_008047 [Vanilla planifolia]
MMKASAVTVGHLEHKKRKLVRERSEELVCREGNGRGGWVQSTGDRTVVLVAFQPLMQALQFTNLPCGQSSPLRTCFALSSLSLGLSSDFALLQKIKIPACIPLSNY